MMLTLHCSCRVQVEVLCASMGNTLGSVGGFCAGTEEVRAVQWVCVYTCCLAVLLVHIRRVTAVCRL